MFLNGNSPRISVKFMNLGLFYDFINFASSFTEKKFCLEKVSYVSLCIPSVGSLFGINVHKLACIHVRYTHRGG